MPEKNTKSLGEVDRDREWGQILSETRLSTPRQKSWGIPIEISLTIKINLLYLSDVVTCKRMGYLIL